ncbi:hypothetical protein V3C99_014877 [Haemonchus contortus]
MCMLFSHPLTQSRKNPSELFLHCRGNMLENNVVPACCKVSISNFAGISLSLTWIGVRLLLHLTCLKGP